MTLFFLTTQTIYSFEANNIDEAIKICTENMDIVDQGKEDESFIMLTSDNKIVKTW